MIQNYYRVECSRGEWRVKKDIEDDRSGLPVYVSADESML